jgi:hypothetical protein
MAASSVERVLLIRILNVVMSSVEVATSPEYLSPVAYVQPDAFLLFLVRFVIADYFVISDLSVFWNVGEFDKEICVGSRNVQNPLE